MKLCSFQKLCSLTLLPYVYNVHDRNFAPLHVLSSVLVPRYSDRHCPGPGGLKSEVVFIRKQYIVVLVLPVVP